MPGITSRIDAITHIPPSHRAVVLPPPRSVKVELTAACDFKCFFCATAKGLRSKGHMDFELYKQIAKEMREAGVEELGLFYLGESFLYKHLPDAIRFAKKECGYPYVFLTTNGHRATKDRTEACFRAGLDSLKFSFNWGGKEECVSVTGVDAFERVVANISDAKSARDAIFEEIGHKCGLWASSILYDGEQQGKMAAAVERIRPFIDQHYYLPLYNQAGLVESDERDKGLNPTAGNMGRVGNLVPPLPCWAVFSEGHVTYDGKLTACCFDHNDSFTMGDLTRTHFMDAWNSREFQKLRLAHLSKDVSGTQCSNCVAYA